MIYTVNQLKKIINLTISEGEAGRNIENLLMNQEKFKENFRNISQESFRLNQNLYSTFSQINHDSENLAKTLFKTQEYLSNTKSKLHSQIRTNTSLVSLK